MTASSPSLLPLRAAEVTALHDGLLQWPLWPDAEPPTPAGETWQWVQANHRCNSRLWAEEDLARRTTVPADAIAANKRAIDGYNQARNDATERIDEILLRVLGRVVDDVAARGTSRTDMHEGARLNSETAGSMIDRLSILALKLGAMQRQARRSDIDDADRAAAESKVARLAEQRADLAGCLDALLEDTLDGRAYFKVYRQYKMYNDPRLNPVLVAERASGT